MSTTLVTFHFPHQSETIYNKSLEDFLKHNLKRSEETTEEKVANLVASGIIHQLVRAGVQRLTSVHWVQNHFVSNHHLHSHGTWRKIVKRETRLRSGV